MCFSCGAGRWHNANNGTDSSGDDSEDDCEPCAAKDHSGKGAAWKALPAAATTRTAAKARAAAARAPRLLHRRAATTRLDHAASPVPQALRVTVRACRLECKRARTRRAARRRARRCLGGHAPRRRPERVRRLRRGRFVEREPNHDLRTVHCRLVHLGRYEHDAHELRFVSRGIDVRRYERQERVPRGEVQHGRSQLVHGLRAGHFQQPDRQPVVPDVRQCRRNFDPGLDTLRPVHRGLLPRWRRMRSLRRGLDGLLRKAPQPRSLRARVLSHQRRRDAHSQVSWPRLPRRFRPGRIPATGITVRCAQCATKATTRARVPARRATTCQCSISSSGRSSSYSCASSRSASASTSRRRSSTRGARSEYTCAFCGARCRSCRSSRRFCRPSSRNRSRSSADSSGSRTFRRSRLWASAVSSKPLSGFHARLLVFTPSRSRSPSGSRRATRCALLEPALRRTRQSSEFSTCDCSSSSATFVLPPVTTVIFETFLCDDNFGTAEASYLVADYAVECHGSDYRWLQVYAAVGIVVYPVGINVMYGWLVASHRNNHREHLGFLLDAYKPEYFYWEIVDNLRRLSLTGLLSFFSERSRVLAAALFSLLPSASERGAALRHKPRQRAPGNRQRRHHADPRAPPGLPGGRGQGHGARRHRRGGHARGSPRGRRAPASLHARSARVARMRWRDFHERDSCHARGRRKRVASRELRCDGR